MHNMSSLPPILSISERINIMLTANFDNVPARIITGKEPTDSEEGGERAEVPSRPDSGQDISIAGEEVNTGIVSAI